MRLLVLGGTQDVGGAVVETALARGDQVTTLNRGVSGPPAAGAQPLHADRTDRAAVAAALGASSWDAVIDTWSGAPVAVSQSAALLAGRANLVWVPPEVIEAAGIEPWTELPVWVPPTGEYTGLHNGDVSAAYAAGLSCRPVAETVADTWRWLQAEGYPPERPGRPSNGLDPDREQQVLASLAS